MRTQNVLPGIVLLAVILPAQGSKTKGSAPGSKPLPAASAKEAPEHRTKIEKRVLEMRDAMRRGKVPEHDVYVRVLLKNKNKFKGVVKNGRFAEVYQGLDYVIADRDQRGAGLRLWYAAGSHGFLFVPYAEIASYEIGKALTLAQGRALEQEVVVRSPRPSKPEPAKKPAVKSVSVVQPLPSPALTEPQKALLKEFPPSDGWGPDRIATLKQRRIALGVYPNEQERKFEAQYEAWYVAFELQNKQVEARSAASQAESQTPATGGKTAPLVTRSQSVGVSKDSPANPAAPRLPPLPNGRK
jgi:hypothetical protein